MLAHQIRERAQKRTNSCVHLFDNNGWEEVHFIQLSSLLYVEKAIISSKSMRAG